MNAAYIISTYNEYGADDAVATLDKGKVIDMIRNFRTSEWEPAPGQWDNEVKVAETYLAQEEPFFGKHNLSADWGGLQLHILELL